MVVSPFAFHDAINELLSFVNLKSDILCGQASVVDTVKDNSPDLLVWYFDEKHLSPKMDDRKLLREILQFEPFLPILIVYNPDNVSPADFQSFYTSILQLMPLPIDFNRLEELRKFIDAIISKKTSLEFLQDVTNLFG